MAGLDLGLTNTPAVVTGGGSGIGRATARLLGENGAKVAVVDRDGATARATAEEIIAQGGKAIALTADVSSEKDVRAAAADAEAAFGVIRVLVNNAGTGGLRRPMLDLPLESWKKVLDVNLTSVFLFTQIIARRMVDAGGGGAIVNVASVAGLNGSPNLPAYAASKHGVVGFTRTVALELASCGVRVNAVAPAMVSTNMLAPILGNAAGAAEAAASHPLGRVAEPREIADSIVFLASKRASFITGTVITIDGGFLAGK